MQTDQQVKLILPVFFKNMWNLVTSSSYLVLATFAASAAAISDFLQHQLGICTTTFNYQVKLRKSQMSQNQLIFCLVSPRFKSLFSINGKYVSRSFFIRSSTYGCQVSRDAPIQAFKFRNPQFGFLKDMQFCSRH